jgi:DNA-binding MarR family transcriptional regulator
METTISQQLEMVLKLTKATARFNRKLDGHLSAHGLGYNDFIILYYIMQAPEKRLRRIDLAELMGVTASGVTRMLAPMEKIGLVSRESNERDARISYVVLAPGGKRLFEESLKTAEYAATGLASTLKPKKLELMNEALGELTDNI